MASSNVLMGVDESRIVYFQESLISLVFFTPTVFYAVYFSKNLNFDHEYVAWLLFSLSLSSRVSRVLFSGLIGSVRSGMFFSLFCLIGFLGFLLLALLDTDQPPALFYLSLMLIGLFYGNTASFIKTFFYYYKKDNISFAKLSVFTNIGSMIGPLFFNFGFNHHPRYALGGLGLILLINSFFCYRVLNKIEIPKQISFYSYVRKKGVFTVEWLNGINIFFIWFVYSFFFTAIPLLLVEIDHSFSSYIGFIAFINGLLVIFFSIKINQIIKNFSSINVMYSFIILTIVSAVPFFLNHSLFNLFIILIGVTLLEIGAMPAYSKINAIISVEKGKSFMVSLTAIFVGLGESIGAFFSARWILGSFPSYVFVLFFFFIVGIGYLFQKKSLGRKFF